MKWSSNIASSVIAVLDSEGYTLLMEMMQDRINEIFKKLSSPNTDWETTIRLRGELEGITRFLPEHVVAEINRSLEASNGRRVGA